VVLMRGFADPVVSSPVCFFGTTNGSADADDLNSTTNSTQEGLSEIGGGERPPIVGGQTKTEQSG